MVPGARAIILTAVEFEAKHVARKLGLARFSRHEWRGGSVGKFEIYLFLVGMRAVSLPTIAPRTADVVLMAGLAGALDPNLKVGDVLVEAVDAGQPNRSPVFHTTS